MKTLLWTPEMNKERLDLIHKKFCDGGGLSAQEERRFQWLQKRSGDVDYREQKPFLDKLEKLVRKQERLAKKVQQVVKRFS